MNYEILGLIATCFIVLSFLQSHILNVRFVNLIGSILFVIYGIQIGALSVWVLNGINVLINTYWLIKGVKLQKDTLNHLNNVSAIVVGYPGIGKSTLSRKDLKYIDLESSNFELKYGLDATAYVQAAVSIASQGYVVFVSSHKSVRDCLATYMLPTNIKLIYCYPSYKLKTGWVEKLNSRYVMDPSDKNKRAYERARNCYSKDIHEMATSSTIRVEIDSLDYDLGKLLNNSVVEK